MAYGNWDALEREYQVYLTTPLVDHARAMLQLIPELRAAVPFDRIIPFSSHGTLCLQAARGQGYVAVLYEGDQQYQVYVQPPGHPPTDEVSVSRAELMRTLIDYCQRLQQPLNWR